MVEQNYAVYVDGKDGPAGIVSDSTLGAVAEICQALGKKYRTEPVTAERAKEIRKSITRLSPGLDKLLSEQ